MKILPCGDTAVLLECADAVEARMWAHRLGGHVPVTLGANTVLVKASRNDTQQLLNELEQLGDMDTLVPDTQQHTLSVTYDGLDLARVADVTGLSTTAVIEAHTNSILTVGFSGFAPGFAYLVDGDPRLVVPRLEVPRPHVSAGSVALAGAFSGIYPRESAGGWLIIGHTREWLWDVKKERPARLQPGDTVRFQVSR